MKLIKLEMEEVSQPEGSFAFQNEKAIFNMAASFQKKKKVLTIKFKCQMFLVQIYYLQIFNRQKSIK